MPRTTSFSRARGAVAGAHHPGGRDAAASDHELDELEHEEPEGESYEESTDWGRIGLFAAGLAAGLTIGAGVMLLVAPQSGEETRELLGARARAWRSNADDGWDDLRDELRWLARRGRRKLRRSGVRGRWRAEDLIDDVKRKRGW
jgi:gas vesicle protein